MLPPKILLLQVREANDPVIPEEIRIFARRAGVPESHVTPHSLLLQAPTLQEARRFDAVMVGGSGEYFVSRENLPDFEKTLEFLRSLVDAGQPVFASCFGFQMIVRALGGEVSYHPEKMELGTYAITCTEAGRQDPLFSQLQPVFPAHLGHKDQATRLPEGVIHLAFSELAPYQAIRIPGKPIWATQFHPEVTREQNLGRFKRYINLYAQTMEPTALKAVIDRFTPAVDSERLIPLFMAQVFDWSPEKARAG